jgi:hypothetical protein
MDLNMVPHLHCTVSPLLTGAAGKATFVIHGGTTTPPAVLFRFLGGARPPLAPKAALSNFAENGISARQLADTLPHFPQGA